MISSGTAAGAGAWGATVFASSSSFGVDHSIPFNHLQDQLVTGLDHSFQSGPILPKPLSIFPQPLAYDLQRYDLLA
jgi:hypothetical protein